VSARGARQLLGRGNGEVLRVQLADDHLHDRGDREGEHGADGDRHDRVDTGAAEQHPDRFADERLRDEADEQAGDGDAELGTGEHEGRALRDPQSAGRGGVTLGSTGSQLRAVDRHEGELLGHEVAVGGDDREDQHDAEEEREQRLDHRMTGRSGLWLGESDGAGLWSTAGSTPPQVR